MDPADFSARRRELLRSLGVAGGTFGLSSGFATASPVAPRTSQDAQDVDWQAATASVDDLMGGIIERVTEDFVDVLTDWLYNGFDALGSVYDKVTSIAAEAADIQAMQDIHFLATDGQELLDRIEEAPDEVEDDEEGEDGDDGGSASSSSKSSSRASTGTPQQDDGARKHSTSGAFFGGIADSIVSGFQSLSDAAREYVSEAYDNIEAFIDRIADGLWWIFEEVAEFLIEMFLAPIRQFGSHLADALTADDATGIDVALDFPGLSIDLPIGISTPFVTTGQQGANGSNASHTAGFAGSSSSIAEKRTAGASKVNAGGGTASSLEAMMAVAAGPTPYPASAGTSPGPFEDYLEQARNQVQNSFGGYSPIIFEERECVQARGPVSTVGFQFDLPDLGAVSNDITPWIGIEPGRPCVYTGFDPGVSVGVDIEDVTDAVRQNQAEALAVARYVEDYVNDHVSQLESILIPAGEDVSPEATPTYEEVHEMTTTIRRDLAGIESEIESSADLTLTVSTVLADVGVPEATAKATELCSRVEGAANELAASELVADLLAIQDAAEAGGISAPSELDRIAAFSGDLPSPSGDVTTASFELPDLLAQSSSSLAEWIADLSTSERSRIESAANVDLDDVQEGLTNPGLEEFSIAEAIRDFADRVRERQDVILEQLNPYLSIGYDFTEGWDEWLCTGVCFNPLIPAPVPVTVQWITEELWKTAKELAEEYVPQITLPSPLDDIARDPLKALLAIIVVVLLVAAVIYLAPYIVAAASILAGVAGSVAAGIIGAAGSGTAAVGIALVPIVIALVITGNGDVLRDFLSDLLDGEQPSPQVV